MSDSLLRAASSLWGSGKFQEAAALFQQVLQQQPRNFHALHGLGMAHFRCGRVEDADRVMNDALRVNPRSPEALFHHACVLMSAGRPQEALARFTAALDISPGVPQAWAGRAGALMALRRPAEALESLDRAVKLAPDVGAIRADRAQVLMALNRAGDALASVEQAIRCEPRNASFILMRADLLATLNRRAEAIAAYDAGLALRPDISDGWNRRGIALAELGRKAEALDSFDRAIRADANNMEARNNRANILFETKRFPEAAREFEHVVRAAPQTPYAAGFLIQSRLRSCDWQFLDSDRKHLSSGLANGQKLIDPQGYLSICEDPEYQLRCARIFMQDEGQPSPVARHSAGTGQRIRVAYVSADFRPHPVAFLIAGVFEHHDRAQFELTGVSLGATASSGIRGRIRGAFEHFIDAAGRSDDDVARELARRNIDVAIDLTGFTDGCRPGILLRRPAPIQVNYLGFPGTMGSPHIDYILADRFLIPDHDRRYYSEKVVWLPHSYQANDSKREISDRIFTRAECGLPDNGFVFCCFNNNYKITREIFGVWMRLLSQVPDSVLWLLQDNEDAAANLRREAMARGVAPERLIFAPRIAPPDHLARQHLADLFLDTSPYGAHTTCSDALFVGLPVISLYGPTFPARVAVSLLNAAGSPELATGSIAEYESRAQHLAQNRDELTGLRNRLLHNRKTCPLFDTAMMTRHLEYAYREMVARHLRGLPPQPFAVEPPID